MTEYTVVLIAFGLLSVAVGITAVQNSRLKRELDEHHSHFEAIQQMFLAVGVKLMEMDTKVKEKENV